MGAAHLYPRTHNLNAEVTIKVTAPQHLLRNLRLRLICVTACAGKSCATGYNPPHNSRVICWGK